jgi:hypothetical protein
MMDRRIDDYSIAPVHVKRNLQVQTREDHSIGHAPIKLKAGKSQSTTYRQALPHCRAQSADEASIASY